MKYLKTYEARLPINVDLTKKLIDYLTNRIGDLKEVKDTFKYFPGTIDIDYVKELLEDGADPNAHDIQPFSNSDNFGSILHMACFINNAGLAKLLIDKYKVDVNDKNSASATPAYISSNMNHLDTLKVLVEGGADINITNSANISPLTTAGYNNSWDCAIYLLENGAEPKAFNIMVRTGKNYKFQKKFIEMYPDIFIQKFRDNDIHQKIKDEYEYIFTSIKYNL